MFCFQKFQQSTKQTSEACNKTRSWNNSQEREGARSHSRSSKMRPCGYMLFKIRVGRSDYYFIFCNNFVCLMHFLYKQNCKIYIFQFVTWCHGSLLLHFQWLTCLISADVLSTARECYKNTFSKVIFHICCNKNRLEAEDIFLREESTVKSQKRH